ncbi:MAG: DUF308 domain-containing protein [Spirochaetaceae bacterium]|nr:DUF308 domain-containing protein [Spirochaetaceae bacterium]MBQ7905664.1 DUF308 domain-containing protein [Spirochaetaceae bacterium]
MRKTYIGIGVLAIIIGLMMLIVPHQCIKAIVIILGVFSVANGVYNLFAIRRLIADSDFAITITIRGIISIIVGLLAILLPLIFAGVIWTIMVYILAFYLLISSGMEIYGATKMKKVGINTKPYIAEIIGSIIIALILLIIPAEIGTLIVRLLGIAIMIVGIGLLFFETRNKTLIVYAEEVPNDPNESNNA